VQSLCSEATGQQIITSVYLNKQTYINKVIYSAIKNKLIVLLHDSVITIITVWYKTIQLFLYYIYYKDYSPLIE
jgi:hypothetical protein